MKGLIGFLLAASAVGTGVYVMRGGRGMHLSGSSRRRGRGLRGPAEVTELKLFIDNDGDLYRQQTTSILRNLVTKMAKGVYDRSKAEKLWSCATSRAHSRRSLRPHRHRGRACDASITLPCGTSSARGGRSFRTSPRPRSCRSVLARRHDDPPSRTSCATRRRLIRACTSSRRSRRGTSSDGLDEAKRFQSEPEALKFAKKCVKDGKGMNPHALVSNPYAGVQKTVSLTRTRRLQVKSR